MSLKRDHRLNYVDFYPQPVMKSTPAKFSELSTQWKLLFIMLYLCGAACIFLTIEFVWSMFFKMVGL